jgi:hypothetical protein
VLKNLTPTQSAVSQRPLKPDEEIAKVLGEFEE